MFKNCNLYKKWVHRRYCPNSFVFIHGNIIEQILVASVSRHVDTREEITNTKNVFTNGKLCLRNLEATYDGLTTSVCEGRAMGVIYFVFCKAFEVLPHNILVSKWERYGFYGWKIKWIRNGQMAVSKGLQSTALCPLKD